VQVNGRLVVDPFMPVVPERVRVTVDGAVTASKQWRTLLFHKPRGVITTRRDPQGRRTVFDVIGDAARGLVTIGRLDFASSGLLLLTTDTQMANRIADPVTRVPRVYVVTVRGRFDPTLISNLETGIVLGREILRANHVEVQKVSARESHLVVELREGRNREVRRLLMAIGNEVTRLKRVSFGGLTLGQLKPGEWREITRAEIASAFPSIAIRQR
jgi:23S rRNA pseudouridine2605 synthase